MTFLGICNLSIFIVLISSCNETNYYKKVSDNFDARHTFTEVKINDSWIIQDPDFNIQYINKETGKLLSTRELFTLAINKITPCNISKKCGWKMNKVEHLKNDYLELYMIHEDKILYNHAKFNISKFFKKNKKTFIEFAKKKYKVPIFSLSDN